MSQYQKINASEVEQKVEDKLEFRPRSLYNERPGRMFTQTPNTPGVVWPVATTFENVDIQQIDAFKQEVTFSVAFYNFWYDEKTKDLTQTKVITTDDPWDIQRPQTNFMKVIAEEEKARIEWAVGNSGGLIRTCSRRQMTIREEFELQNFPFDTQPINITLRTKMPALKQIMLFHSNSAELKHGAEIHVPHVSGWTFEEHLCGEYAANEPGQFPIKILQLVFKRQVMFYLAHLYFPLLILQLLTFTCVTIDILDSFGEVLNIILIQLLAVVAFRYSLQSVLPEVPYFTLVDYYFFGTFFLSLFIAVMDFLFTIGQLTVAYREDAYLYLFLSWILWNLIYFLICFTRRMNLKDCEEQAWDVMKEYRSGPGGKVFLSRQMWLGKEVDEGA